MNGDDRDTSCTRPTSCMTLQTKPLALIIDSFINSDAQTDNKREADEGRGEEAMSSSSAAVKTAILYTALSSGLEIFLLNTKRIEAETAIIPMNGIQQKTGYEP